MHIYFIVVFSQKKRRLYIKMTSNQVNVSKPGKFIRSSLHKKYSNDRKTHIIIIRILFSSQCELDANRMDYDKGG